MELKLINSSETVALSDAIFACEFKEPLVHQVITSYMAASRAGTKAQKTRAEVSGGGIKPFKQKGSGRARAGTIRSPIWRKGGVTFAAKPRSFKQKVNRKMYQAAIKSILSELVRQDRIILLEEFFVENFKTKNLLSKLDALGLQGNVLFVMDKVDENLYLAARNLFRVDIRDVVSTISDPIALVRVDNVVMTKAALMQIEDLLK